MNSQHRSNGCRDGHDVKNTAVDCPSKSLRPKQPFPDSFKQYRPLRNENAPFPIMKQNLSFMARLTDEQHTQCSLLKEIPAYVIKRRYPDIDKSHRLYIELQAYLSLELVRAISKYDPVKAMSKSDPAYSKSLKNWVWDRLLPRAEGWFKKYYKMNEIDEGGGGGDLEEGEEGLLGGSEYRENTYPMNKSDNVDSISRSVGQFMKQSMGSRLSEEGEMTSDLESTLHFDAKEDSSYIFKILEKRFSAKTVQAFRLWTDGYTLQEIAQMLGLKNRAGARYHVCKVCRASNQLRERGADKCTTKMAVA